MSKTNNDKKTSVIIALITILIVGFVLFNLSTTFNQTKTYSNTTKLLQQNTNATLSQIKVWNNIRGFSNSNNIVNYTLNGKTYQLPVWIKFTFLKKNAVILNGINNKTVPFTFSLNKTSSNGTIFENGLLLNQTLNITVNYKVSLFENSTTVSYTFTFVNLNNLKETNISLIPGKYMQVFSVDYFEYNNLYYEIFNKTFL